MAQKSSSMQEGKGGRRCQCQRIAGPVGSWVSSRLGTGHTRAVMTHWHQERGISIPSAPSLDDWKHGALSVPSSGGDSHRSLPSGR